MEEKTVAPGVELITETVSKPGAPPARVPGALRAAFDRFTSDDPRKPKPEMPRAEVTLTIPASACLPGVFLDDFDLTLRATTAAIEQSLARQYSGNAAGYNGALTRSTVWKFNGEIIGAGEDEWLWEALGPKGRNLVMLGYLQLAAPSEEQVKKAIEGLTKK